MRTLVLDQSYMPHRVISWRRAVSMWFDGKVQVLEEYDEDIRSVSITIKMPAVVRLLSKTVGRKRAVRFSRMNVATRDNFTCQYCGEKFSLKKLTYDHVVPRSQGGRTNWRNIVVACRPCNEYKGGRTPQQAGMHLLKEPVKPKSLPVVTFMVDPQANIPDQWASWVYWHGKVKED